MSFDRHDELVDLFHAAIAIVDVSNRGALIVYVNDTFSRLNGYPAAEAMGRNLGFLLGPDSDVASARLLRRAIQRKESATVELISYRKDRTQYWCLVSVAPLPDDDGTVRRMVAVQRDISDLKARQLTGVTAQRLAALGELAGGIAHDFNNLLSVVLGNCDLLHEQCRGASGSAEALKVIRVAAQRGAEQVRRLMTLTKAPFIDVEPVDLCSVGADLTLMLRGTLPAGVQLQFDIDDDARWVLGDLTQLQGALLNLILNARDALARGGSIVVGSRLPPEGSARQVRVTVVDDGIGMDEATMRRVFDPFFTTRKAGEGHGLGLAMVHAYVQNTGGSISVHSAPGQGSRFELLLPAAPPVEAGQWALDLRQSPQPAGGRALLVEDDDVLRLTAEAMLNRLAFQVVGCSSAVQALQRVQRGEHFDLMCSDHLLGEDMTGAELAAAVRSHRPMLPIVLMSGWTDDGPIEGAFDAFIAKPYSLPELEAGIAAARSRRSMS